MCIKEKVEECITDDLRVARVLWLDFIPAKVVDIKAAEGICCMIEEFISSPQLMFWMELCIAVEGVDALHKAFLKLHKRLSNVSHK